MADLVRYGGVVAGQEEIAAVTAVLRGQGWASGPVTEQFEAAAAAAAGHRFALFVNSGSSALLLALACLRQGTRVAMPAVQFPTLWSAAVWNRLEPVLVDVGDTLNLDPRLLDSAGPLGAVAFVHVAGNPAGAAGAGAWCAAHGVPLIEDVCEGFGGRDAWGAAVGARAWLCATSTHAAHQASTGEGGLVFTSDRDAWGRMRRIRDWGRAHDDTLLPEYHPGYVFSEFGLNLHATDIQAALGLVQLRKLEQFRDARDAAYRFFRRELAGLPVQFPRPAGVGAQPSWFCFPLLTAERDKLALHLADRGIETRPILCGNLARQPLPGMPDPEQFPVADDVYRRGLWFSVHPSLTGAQRQHVASSVREFFT